LFHDVIALVSTLSNTALTPAHFQKIEQLTGLQRLQETNYTIYYVIEKQVSALLENIEVISGDASNEASLLSLLKEI